MNAVATDYPVLLDIRRMFACIGPPVWYSPHMANFESQTANVSGLHQPDGMWAASLRIDSFELSIGFDSYT